MLGWGRGGGGAIQGENRGCIKYCVWKWGRIEGKGEVRAKAGNWINLNKVGLVRLGKNMIFSLVYQSLCHGYKFMDSQPIQTFHKEAVLCIAPDL